MEQSHVNVGRFIFTIDRFLDNHDKSIVAGCTALLVLANILLWLTTRSSIAAAARAASAAEDSVKVARDTLGLERAWVSTPKVNYFNDVQPGWATYTFENLGKVPARGLYVGIRISTSPDYLRELDALLHEKIQHVRENQEHFLCTTILPHDVFSIDDNIGNPEIDAVSALTTGFKHVIVGCAIYSITNSIDSLSYTTFVIEATVGSSRSIKLHRIYTVKVA